MRASSNFETAGASADSGPAGALAAVIGSPARHSLSPAIHNAAFKQTGLNWVFVAWEVPAGFAADALQAVDAFNLAGLSVTMPHKTAVAQALELLSPEAQQLQAVNCVVRQGGQLVGHNTDGAGLIASLRADAGFDPDGKPCLVVGAGGAGRAAACALAQAGAARVGIVNRTQAKAQAAAELAGQVGEVVTIDELQDFALVVNATPIGMPAFAGQTPFPASRLHTDQLVVDLIYDPWETPLLKAAKSSGVPAINGLGMLVHQAALAFELWTGVAAPLEVMTAAANSKISHQAEQQPQL